MTDDQSAQLHAESIIIDGLEISRWHGETLRHLVQGGLTAINATVAVHENFRQTISNINGWYHLFEQYQDLIMPARSVADIKAAKQSGKTGIIFGFQNTAPIEDDLSLLAIFKELGVRIIQITYNEGNYAGAGCLESKDWGLSRFGEDLIVEMNRQGLLIDLSHVGYRTSMEVIEASQQPVAFTHANPRALCDNPRNKTDEQLLAIARKGGIVGANIFPPFLAKGSQATIEDFVDAIDYMVKLVGIDHVAIGTDFTEDQPEVWFRWLLMRRGNRKQIVPLDYPIINPEGIRSAAEFPNITRALVKRGYADADVKKIMGENFLRVFQTVWL